MPDRIGISRVYPPYIPDRPRQGPELPSAMTSKDVLRGVWHAYLWGIAILAVLALPALLNPLGYLAFVFIGALVGLFLTLPAAFAALSIYFGLRAFLPRIRWWVAPLASTLILAATFTTLAGTPLGAIWGLILGPIGGYAFWNGAIGHATCANLRGAVT